MVKILIATIWLTWFVTVANAQIITGKILEKSFVGPISKKTVLYNIYLPQGYDTGTERYPVIYHLHGINGTQGGNQNTTVPESFEKAYQAGLISPVIVVFPNGYNNSMWADSKNGTKPAETNILPELISHVDSGYRTLADRRYRVIEGFSMGGFGAAKFIAKFYRVFSVCVIYDGAIHTWQTLQRNHPDLVSEIFDNDETYFNQYSPWTFASINTTALRDSVKLRMVVGSLTSYNRSFRDYITALNIPFEYIETDCAHNLGCLLNVEGVNSAAFIAKSMATPTHVETSFVALPQGFLLLQNYPNPFNPTTVISFQLPMNNYVTLKVFDVIGRELARLVEGYLEAGNHSVRFDAGNLPSGVYFYKLTSGKYAQVRKAVLMR
jgi:endo-1,4-beta-xylanase